MRRISADDDSTMVKEGKNDSTTHEQLLPGKYIACVYDKEWHSSCVLQHSKENNDVQVLFMKRSEQTGFPPPPPPPSGLPVTLEMTNAGHYIETPSV